MVHDWKIMGKNVFHQKKYTVTNGNLSFLKKTSTCHKASGGTFIIITWWNTLTMYYFVMIHAYWINNGVMELSIYQKKYGKCSKFGW